MGHHPWRVLIGGARSAAEQMARDEALSRETIPTVRLFTWQPPALSLGFKQPHPAWLSGATREARWQLVDRPTGGGIAVHGSDVSVAVVVPRELRVSVETLMRAVCQSAVALCATYGVAARSLLHVPASERVTYCLAQPSSYAVMAAGKKLAGFALRRYPKTWLIQGSMLVHPLPEVLRDALPSEVARQLTGYAVSLAGLANAPVSAADAAQRWAAHWSEWWEEGMITQISKNDFADRTNAQPRQSVESHS